MGMTDEKEAELDDLDQDGNKDVRTTQHQRDKMVVDVHSYVSDSDGDDDELSPRPAKRRKGR